MKRPKLIVKKYKFYPSHYIDSEALARREPPTVIRVRFEVEPPNSGRKKVQWQRIRTHIIQQVQLLSVMSTDELYKIKLAIKNNELPQIFLSIVEAFYTNKTEFVPALTEIVVNEIELFDYEGVHSLAKNVRQAPRLNTLVPDLTNIKIPITTST